MSNLVNQMIGNFMNNQMQGMLGQLENQLKQVNPSMYQVYQTARQQNASPNDILKQITKNYDANTMKQFKQQAKQFGISDELLNQI